MWGDNDIAGYGKVKFDTSSQNQLAAQTTVQVRFNTEVRANRKGPNPGYRTEREIFGSSSSSTRKPKPYTQFTPTRHLTPFGANPSKPSVRPKVTEAQKRYYKQLAEFHQKGNMSATRSASPSFGKSADQGAGY